MSAWRPNRNVSCFGCLFPENPRTERGEVLLPTVTRLVASVAANIVISILAGDFHLQQNNLFAIDASAQRIEPFSIAPRPSCRICGKVVSRQRRRA